jgi:hypothetical protein
MPWQMASKFQNKVAITGASLKSNLREQLEGR